MLVFYNHKLKILIKLLIIEVNYLKDTLKTFLAGLNDEFMICNKYNHKDKYNYHAFTIILKKNERKNFKVFKETKNNCIY